MPSIYSWLQQTQTQPFKPLLPSQLKQSFTSVPFKKPLMNIHLYLKKSSHEGISKTDLSMPSTQQNCNEYLQHMKSLEDALVAAGVTSTFYQVRFIDDTSFP